MAKYRVWLNLTPLSLYSAQFFSILLPSQYILTYRKMFQCLTEEFQVLVYFSGPVTYHQTTSQPRGGFSVLDKTHQSLNFSPWPFTAILLHLFSPSLPFTHLIHLHDPGHVPLHKDGSFFLSFGFTNFSLPWNVLALAACAPSSGIDILPIIASMISSISLQLDYKFTRGRISGICFR